MLRQFQIGLLVVTLALLLTACGITATPLPPGPTLAETEPTPTEVAGTEPTTTPTREKATQVALEAIQALGGNGYTTDFPTGRLLRDAKLYEIGAGTSEIRRMLIGREIMVETK